MKQLLLLAITLFATTYVTLSQNKGSSSSRHFNVGFRSFLLHDSSRPPLKEQTSDAERHGRALQINLWYPTKSSSNKKILFSDYAKLKATETDSTVAVDKRESLAKAMLAQNYNTTIDTIDGLFNNSYSFNAVADAAFPSQKFPLVAIIHNDPVGFAPLAEHLATNGFVVVNFPLSGTSSKNFDWQTISGIQTEIADMNFAVKAVSKLPMVDSTQVLSVGYSYGAMAALAYQIVNKNVKAVISLDGGIGSLWGGEMVFKVPGFNIGELTKPIFHAWSDRDNPYSDHRWLANYICADKFLVKFGKLRPGDFVEGILFEKLQPGITATALGKKADGAEAEYVKLIESVTLFAKWATSSNNTREGQWNASAVQVTRIKKWDCKKT